ncbi:ABC transporter substrate-binding protein [Granulicella sibirica]|uniref:Oligopeptide ABC transporter, periplasmic oligopeptide-binding protein OppA n=1 Tax=Granulicella sibirica TaxID=2479048 RepID=A0A4Q0T367_9BACT|nr:ABC transporter substrate-binding protein [Granulicella sibirica]RXH57342.1 Oligopeptide ABC transporter, periplasmic oligopeptide-binding protein OppA [Granulicella sibirica]
MGLRTNRVSIGALLFIVLPLLTQTSAKAPGELAWAIRYDPKTFDPAKVDDQSSELVRFLTGGVLLRVNRLTQQPEPDLAETYSLSPDGRVLTFHLRPGLRFSDGSDLTSRDAAWSIRRVLAPVTAAPAGEEFLTPKDVKVEAPDAHTVRVTLPKRVVAIARVFDEIAIEPADHPSEARVTSGPFILADYKRGQSIRLKRNPNYWRHDGANVQLPYLSGIRLDILSNREQEISGFQRGDYDLIDNLPAEYFTALSKRSPGAVRDLGASLNTEQMWFNESPTSPLPAYEKAWFTNRGFRVAISQAIHRADLARIAYDGHATPAYSFISPANTPWYDKTLNYPHEDVAAATRLLAASGFHLSGKTLYDAGNQPVKFSILTNAGNAARQKMATLIQQDLAALGIEITIVTLDFPALIERFMHTQDYQACLLGLSNVDPEPNSMMNLWLSSSPNHQWNPSEKSPATPWEAEIDRQMLIQATSLSAPDRKRAVDQVQQIVADQQPFIYLVHPNTLYAISPQLGGVQPAVLSPGVVWNVDMIRRQGTR